MGHREGKACCGDTVRAVLGCSLHQPWLVLEVVMPWWEGCQGDPRGQWEGTARPQDPMDREIPALGSVPTRLRCPQPGEI